MNDFVKKLLKPLASLRLTVVLLAAAMVVIFAGTWAQMDADIWQVQQRYFHAWFCWIDFRTFARRPIAGGIPFVGGYFLIWALLANLLAAHFVRFKLNWKRSGIILIHLGLIMLLIGELLTSAFAREGQMTLVAGQSLNYKQDIRTAELAVVDSSPTDHDNVTVVPASMLQPGSTVHDSRLPFDIHVVDYYVNSERLGPFQDGPKADPRVNAGSEAGRRIVMAPAVRGTDSEKVNLPATILSLSKDGKDLGTYLVSLWARAPQDVKLPDGRTLTIDLRFERTYEPYTVQLLKFTHDTFVGTDLDKNFASKIRLIDPAHGVNREVLIWMNHPLRYNGETFYQQSFGRDEAGHDTGATTLEIVRNPGWLLPYFALAIAILGLIIQFGGHLIRFLLSRTAPAAVAPRQIATASYSPWSIAVGVVTVVFALAYIFAHLPRDTADDSRFDLNGFGQVPINYEGRTMPLDTLARMSLKILHGSETLEIDGKRVPPAQWLLDVMAKPDAAMNYPIFRIDNPEVLSAIGLNSGQKFFSFDELLAAKEKLQPQIDHAFAVQNDEDAVAADVTTRKFIELGQHLTLYIKLNQLEGLYLVPPIEGRTQWQSVGEAVKAMGQSGTAPDSLRSFMLLLENYHDGKVADFNATLGSYLGTLERVLPTQGKIDYEATFNRFDPFGMCMMLYVTVLLLGIASWLFLPRALGLAALTLMCVTFLLHTFGLVSRIYISGRPPVTNLYSASIFIAWGAVALSIGLEIVWRNGIGSVVGATLGFGSLLLAQALSLDGDTMHQLRAVLDTNFWLATHVVVITLGYASTFLAGFLAILFIVLGLFTSKLDDDLRRSMTRMVYGIVCFALLFSFVGTILGGIWADQSWGRFWGWDPKENGAILIVVWNAIILHARWGGLVRQRGLMVLAVFGNIVTSWSFFGTNMLGVGLHSYGFMDKAFPILLAFMLIQIGFMALGLFLPSRTSTPSPLRQSTKPSDPRRRPTATATA